MEFAVAHELPGRIRFWATSLVVTREVAYDLTGVLLGDDGVIDARVSPVTGTVLVRFDPDDRPRVFELLATYRFDAARAHEHLATIGREVSALAVPDEGAHHGHALALAGQGPGGLLRFAAYFLLRPFIPAFVRMAMAVWRALPFLLNGLAALRQGRLNVEVLDATAIGLSLARGDFRAVGNITLMFAASEYLEQWTREKSRESLAHSLVVDVDSVWVRRDGIEYHIPILDLEAGDVVVVRSGSSIPVDGVVVDGDATVNEASMTGEGIAVARRAGSSVYAGTVVEDGRLDIRVRSVGAETRVSEIVRFIEESESRKAVIESRAEALADRIVPYSFGLAVLVLLLTRSLSRAASVLLVDYSCAIRLSTPLAVLTAMREGAHHGVLIKGGRYLEALATADVVVFDKTGTLTVARPSVAHVVPLEEYSREDVLCLAACLEEHFPHPVARAVVRKAEQEGLNHEEEHTEVEYVVAHGISSRLRGKRVLVGSSHFVHEDEGVPVGEHQALIDEWAHRGFTILHMSVDGRLVGLLCIEDPM